jgi:peptidyl-prolyl cis-trans isomerase SurA
MSKALMNRNLYRPMLHAKRPLLLALLLACAVTAPAQSLRLSPQLQRLPSLAKIDNTQRAADYIVAIVNSEPVTNNEVRARMVRLEQQLVQQGGAVPPRDELATQVLERLIGERAQLQFAREAGVRVAARGRAGADCAQQPDQHRSTAPPIGV